MPVDALDVEARHKLCAGIFPSGGHDTGAVAGFEHLGAGAVERVYLHAAVVGDESEGVVAGDGRAAVGCGEVSVAAVIAAQGIYFLWVDSRAGVDVAGGCRIGLFLAHAEYLAYDACLARGFGGLAESLDEEFAEHDLFVAELVAEFVAVGYMVCADNLGYDGVGVGNIVFGEPFAQHLASLGHDGLPHLAENGAQSCLGMGGDEEVGPLGLGALRLRSENLHLVARIEPRAQGYELVVDLARDTVHADLAVEGEGYVEHGGAGRQGYELALGSEHHDLRGEEVELDGVEEVDCRGLGVVENVLDGA